VQRFRNDWVSMRATPVQSPAEFQVSAATAPGKVILLGEHAVVYGRPAIAVPVTDVQATTAVAPGQEGSGVHIVAADLPAPDGSPGGRHFPLGQAPTQDPLRTAVELALHAFLPDDSAQADGLRAEPDILVRVSSTIPIARGLGSGAAVGTAVIRAIGQYFGSDPKPDEISRLVYEVEKLHHGTPSGIDNTVIAYEQPVYFVRGQAIMPLSVGRDLSLVIADTGMISSTRQVVDDVRRRRQSQPQRYEELFDEIGTLVHLAKTAIEHGDPDAIGRLMDKNHDLLMALGVSSPQLDELVRAARAAGALGAKMSGAGWGGNMVALVEASRAPAVASALHNASATNVIFSQIASLPTRS
jgi:mevalonate kinase